jgi:hypothetical protein
MNDLEPLPGRADKQIRFGCGFVFGGGMGFLLALRYLVETLGPLIGCTLAGGLLCGWLAMRYGDHFWTDLLHRLFWWW